MPSSSDGRFMLLGANSRNQSRINVAIMSSRCADRSWLFRGSNNCVISILDYLNLDRICQLDIAVTNIAARVIWLSSLRLTNHHMINERRHCNGSIRWVVTRGVRIESLKVRNDQWFTRSINGSTLLGLNVSLLRNVSFGGCNIADNEVISLAHNCPYLSEICLYDCSRVTDASIIALAKWCVRLTALDIGECMNITDDGLTAFAYDCSCIKVDYIDDLECI